jgi:ABC-type nitrate/sulfonate/bicarbonate transport system substrate-binding protein
VSDQTKVLNGGNAMRNPALQLNRRAFMTTGCVAISAMATLPAWSQTLNPLKAVNPTRSASSWPMWLAANGGYFRKYGLEVAPTFGVHPVGIAGLVSGEVQLTNYSLDDVAATAVRDPVLIIYGSILHHGTFALMARSEFHKVEDLKGKRVAVGRVGDPPYHYTVGLIKDYGLKASDIQWVPTGTDAAARITMLVSGQVDAALTPPPAYYRLEQQGLKPLTLMQDHPSIVITVGNTYKKSWVADHPDVPERVLRAQGEAVHCFYTDKAAAIAAYRKFDPSISEADCARAYDDTERANILDRIPLVQKQATDAVIERIGGDVEAVNTFDFTKMIDNRPVRKLIAEGFFEKLYGPQINAEQNKTLEAAYP